MFGDPNLLTPADAAKAAEDVYLLRPADMTIERAFEGGLSSLGPAGFDSGDGFGARRFVVSADARFTGATGRAPIRTGFGYVAHGPGRGDAGTELLIVIRGTEFTSGDDWATNFSIGTVPGPGGHRVHGGFYRTFQSMQAEINRFIERTQARRVHCVGHSLGGALATLLAADLSERRRFADIYCYSFGAPRVGDARFGAWLMDRIGQDRLLRVYHPCDPVPMLSAYPYQQPDMPGLRIASSRDAPILHNFHGMLASYGPAMQRCAWADLADDRRSPNEESEIRWWLDTGLVGQPIGFMSARFVALVERALRFVLDAMNAGLNVGLERQLTRSATLVDTLSASLVLGLEIGDRVASWVRTLIATIARLVGRISLAIEDVTRWLIRYLLDLFLRQLANSARLAVALGSGPIKSLVRASMR